MAMISKLALIRSANLDNMEPRRKTSGQWSWDSNVFDVWVRPDGSASVSKKWIF